MDRRWARLLWRPCDVSASRIECLFVAVCLLRTSQAWRLRLLPQKVRPRTSPRVTGLGVVVTSRFKGKTMLGPRSEVRVPSSRFAAIQRCERCSLSPKPVRCGRSDNELAHGSSPCYRCGETVVPMFEGRRPWLDGR